MELNNDWQSDSFNYVYLFLNLYQKIRDFLFSFGYALSSLCEGGTISH